MSRSTGRGVLPLRLLAGLLGVLLATACAPPPDTVSGSEAEASRPPAAVPQDVVLVLVDSLRADHVGAYGCHRPVTPHLDALAAEGLRFERAWAASSARGQSLSALWTGRLPIHGGAAGLREAVPHPSLPTLLERFRWAGFATGLAGNVPDLRERGFTRGADRIEVDSTPGRWTAAHVTAKALDLLDATGDTPAFLVVDYVDAAEPHLPPPEAREALDVPAPEALLSLPNLRGLARDLPPEIRRSPGFADLVARYDAEIAVVDAALGALIEGLRERDRLADTLVVVAGTHGTEFLEHGYVGNGWTLHEEVLHVPLVVRAAGLSQGVVAEPVSLVDVHATLAGLYRLPLAPRFTSGRTPPTAIAGEDAERGDSSTRDGRTLLVAGASGLLPIRRNGPVLAELVIPELCILRAARQDDTKLVEVLKDAPPSHRADLAAGYDGLVEALLDGTLPRPDPWGEPVRRELYDLTADPAETSDVAADLPDRLAALRRALKEYAARVAVHGVEARPPARRAEPPDPAAAEQLRQLGYL